ncbi:EAL domain-containing protein [Halomonas sp. H5]|uniref:EAL domain-containing protein n=1 Tax=Halomonas sp. H5 TaxID=3423910 RepID=UPI003D362335
MTSTHPNEAAVLDSDQDVAASLSLQLHTLGIRARYYQSRQRLLEELDRRRPQLVVLALEPGRIDGIAVLRDLSRLGYVGAVLLLSGVERKVVRIAERVGRTLGLLMLDSLPKSFRLAELRQRLDGLHPLPREACRAEAGVAPRIGEEIERALTQGEFLVYYQPQLELAGQRISGVEALVRWRHPRRGILVPGQFLGTMTPGQYRRLTRCMLMGVMADVARWPTLQGLDSISVNVTPEELMSEELLLLMEELRAGLAKAPPLVLEVTETAAMDDELLGGEVAARLHLHGLELAIDDFGVGFSSLARLQMLPVSELKLDRSFVSHLQEEPLDAAIVEAVALLGRRLGIRVVAEGVESLATLEALARYGCTHAQGYALAPPMPAEALAGLLTRRAG